MSDMLQEERFFFENDGAQVYGVLHHPAAVFPLRNPAIVSMPVGFLTGIIASLATHEPEAEARFHDEKLRTYLGIGAE